MERIPQIPPCISPIDSKLERPLWSIMIPVYNCAHYLPEALESVLAQDIGVPNMQIEVVDDASTDGDIEELVRQVGKGRVKYFKQTSNVGSLRNFETCINRSRGTLIHLLHGDDRVKAGYYQKIGALFEKYPKIGAAFSGYSCINDSASLTYSNHSETVKEGILQNWLLRIASGQRIQYASMTVRRDVYEDLGSFYGMRFGEDWEMWVRIAKHYAVAHNPEILAEYRDHSTSITWKSALSGEMVHDIGKTIQLISKHLPAEKRTIVVKRAKTHSANYCVGMAHKLWVRTHDTSLVLQQVKLVFRLSRSPYLYYQIAKLILKLALRIDSLNPFREKDK